MDQLDKMVRAARSRQPPRWLKDFVCTKITDDVDIELQSYYEAVKSRCSIEAMNEELKAFKINQTWEITDLRPNHHVIGKKWVYMTKRNKDEIVASYIARLVENG